MSDEKRKKTRIRIPVLGTYTITIKRKITVPGIGEFKVEV